jgi:CMP-N,N'-diacetyllegionaminic acid synthase
MKIAALLTGKKNSTLKNKNFIKILGKPVCFYPAFAASRSKFIQKFYTSSDSRKILDACFKLGYQKINRPKKLSSTNAKHIDVLKHSLKFMKEKHNYKPDLLIVLLANSPTIKTAWIDKCIKKILNNESITSVVPVVHDNDHHPFRAKKISRSYLMPFFKKTKVSSNRQDLPNSFFLGHNFWVLRAKEIYSNNGFGPWSFMGKKTLPFILDEIIDIHTKEDVERCKKWLNNFF